MSKVEKMIAKMRNNPRDWLIQDLMVIASRYEIVVRQGKGSHLSFVHPKWIEILTVPAHRPVKSIYVKKFVSLIDILIEEEVWT